VVARNAFHLLAGQVATTALSIGLNAILARSLGAAEFGLLFLVTSMAGFAHVVVEWGQDSYLVREVARRPQRAGSLLGTSIALRVAGGVLACAPTFLVARLIGYDLRTRELAAVAVAATLPAVVARGYGVVFRGRERMDYDAAVNVLAKALALVLTAAAVAGGGRLLAAILAQGVASAAALPLAAFFLRRLTSARLSASRDVARELVRGGTPFAAMVLTISAQGYLEAVVLSTLAPAVVVGWYGAARMVMNALLTPASILGAASLPGLARASDLPGLRRRVGSVPRPLLWLGTVGAVDTYLFADVAVSWIYGAEGFQETATLLRLFAPLLPLVCVEVLLGIAVMVVRPARLAAAKAVAVLLTTGLNVLLVPPCQARFGNGGIGLLLGFAAGEAFMVAAALLLLPSGTVGRAFVLDVLRALAAAAGTVAFLIALAPLSPLLGIPLSILAFVLASWAVGLVGQTDLETVSALWSRRSLL
jgi:O-antigen/teichoic acid export membrane protein